MCPHRPAASLLLFAAVLFVTSCSDSIGPEARADRVTLNAPFTELEVGGTLALAATVLNATGGVVASQQITWESMNPEVASVSTAGVVTGLRAGTARIRASAGTATGTINLTVHPPSCTRASATGGVNVGQSVSGALAASDCRLFHGSRADGWTLALPQAEAIRIEMVGSGFDAVLFLTDRDMNVLGYADAAGSGVASLVGEYPAGNYVVWATSWNDAVGSYTVSAGTVNLCSGADASGSVALEESVAGTLSRDSCILPHGHAGMAWRLSIPTDVTLRATLTPQGFEGLIVVTTLDLDPVAFGWGPGVGAEVELMHPLPPGEYLLWATSTMGGFGSFTLSVGEARLAGCAAVQDIAVGASVNGQLGHGDCVLHDGRFTEPWRFSLPEAARLQVDMTSSQLDAYLIVTDEAGRIVAVDDDGGVGFNARLVHSFPAGTYTVWATTYSPGEGGAYQLSVQPAAGGNTIGERRGSAVAGTAAGVRKSAW